MHQSFLSGSDKYTYCSSDDFNIETSVSYFLLVNSFQCIKFLKFFVVLCIVSLHGIDLEISF